MRMLLLAAMLVLSACAHQSCTQDQWLVDPNCK
jgi:hypothetical protein